MADGNTVGLDIVARLDQFRAEMAKVPDIGGKAAKEMAAQLSKEIKAAEAAAKKAASAGKEAKASVHGLGDAAGKAGSSAAKLAGALSLVSGGAGDAARNVADLADVGEVAATVAEAAGVSVGALSVGLAALTTVLAAGYLGWQIYNDEDEKQAVIAADVAAAHEKLIPILENTRDATIDLKVATGELSEEQGDLERNSIRAHKALLAATEESRKKMGELREEQGSVGTQIVDLAEEWAPSWTPLGAVIRATTTDSGDLDERITALNGTVTEAIDLTRTDVAVTGDVIRAKGEQKKATDQLKDSIKDLLTFEEQVAALHEKVAGEEADRRMAASSQQSEDAAEGAALMARIEEEQTRKHAEEVAKRLEEDKRAEEERKRNQEITVTSYASLFGSISDLSGTLADSMKDDSEDAARAAFAVSKAAGIAQAAVNTALAVSNALAQPVPPPVAAIMAVAAGAAGAAQVAAIASTPGPSFNDTPGIIQVGQGQGQSIRFAGGDYVAAAKSPDDLKRKVGNGDLFGGRSAPTVRISNRGFDYFMRDTLRANNRTSRAIRGSSRVGHRER